MNKNILFCFLFVFMSIMSYNSFASIVTYNLVLGEGSTSGYGDLNGFLAFESVGIPRSDPYAIDGGYVDFKVYNFFLASHNDVLINSHNESDKIRFMVSGIKDSSLIYHGDRDILLQSDLSPFFFIYFSYLSEKPEDGSLIFTPTSFDIWNTYGNSSEQFKFSKLHAISTYAVSAVDEPGTFTFVLYGLLSVFLIGVIKRTNVIKI